MTNEYKKNYDNFNGYYSNVFVDVFVSCIPPRATKQNTQIIKLRTKDGREFYSLKSDKSVKNAMSTFLDLFREYAPEKIIDFPVAVRVEFSYPFRKNEKKSDLERGFMWCETRPDLDNLAKIFIDSISPVFFKDDALIVFLVVCKIRSNRPGVRLVVSKVQQPQTGKE